MDSSIITNAMDMAFAATEYKSGTGSLGKHIYRKNGAVKKDPAAQLYSGTAKRVEFTPKDLHEYLWMHSLPDAPNNVALVQGVFAEPEVKLCTNERPRAGALTRSKDNTTFSNGPGWLLLDVDHQTLTFEGVRRALVSAVPELADVCMVVVASTSTGIYSFIDPPTKVSWDAPDLTEQMARGIFWGFDAAGVYLNTPVFDANGLHIYIPVLNAAEIPRIGKILEKRLWQAGQGYVTVSENGSRLVRCLVDTAVWSPERLDFISRPTLGEGLSQCRPEPVLIEGRPLDPAKVIDLTAAEEARVEEMIAEALEKARPEAEAKRAKYVKKKAREVSERTKIPLEVAEKQVTAGLEKSILYGAHPIYTADGHVRTAADYLIHGEGLDGELLRDPAEPEYGGGRVVAQFYWNDGRPVIHSFAHGGRTFRVVRERLKVKTGDLAVEVADVENAVVALTEPTMFNRGGELCRVIRLGCTEGDPGQIQRAKGSLQVRGMSDAVLEMELSRVAEFGLYVEGDGGVRVWLKKSPARKLLKSLLECGDARLRPLLGVVGTPTMDLQGRVVQQEGYDSATGLLLDFGGVRYPAVPDKPTKADALAALAVLREAFATFKVSWASDEAESGVIAAVLTGLIRRFLPAAPLFAIVAYAAGTGKSLMARCIATVCLGHTAATLPYTDDKEESKKRWFALLREGTAAVCLDNIPAGAVVESAVLCSILTESTLKDRILGVSANCEVPTNTLILATGNNIEFGADERRRTLKIALDARCEKPQDRTFDRDVLRYCEEHRPALVAAGLTVLRAFAVAGRPNQGGTWGSYEDWWRWVRGSLVWLGMADPGACQIVDVADPDTADLQELIFAWQKCLGTATRFTAGEVIVKCGDTDKADLRKALENVCLGREGLCSRRLGRALVRWKGRVIGGSGVSGGLRLVPDQMKHKVLSWRLEPL